MGIKSIVFCYRALAALAFFLFWGILYLNGGLKALLLAAWHGRLNENVGLRNNYTGIFVIDYPLTLLVAFFHYATNGSDEPYQLLVFEAYSTLQSAFVWLYVEMARPGQKPWTIERPLVFALLWQCVGAGISLPLYFAYHLLWNDSAEVLQVRNINAARAIPFSFLLGAIVPAIVGSAPTWNGPESRSPEVHQEILAAWQLDPIYVSLIQMALTNSSSWLQGERSGGQKRDARAAHAWTRASYLAAAFCSSLGHLYTVGRFLTSTNEGTNFVRMYVPFPFTGPAGAPDILARGPWLFLQYDVIIYSIASLTWIFLLLSRMSRGPPLSNLGLAFALTSSCITIGAGATVSLGLYVREGLLPDKAKGKEVGQGPLMEVPHLYDSGAKPSISHL